MHFFVGSENPVKLAAAKSAGIQQWPDVVVMGFDVKSGVAAQPRTDHETRKGAENRAVAALQKGFQTGAITTGELALGIGLEGGVMEIAGELWTTVWVAVTGNGTDVFVANGARFKLPDVIAKPILAGEEMGVAVGQLIANPLVKQQQGAIGVVTKGYVDRAEEYAAIAKLAIGLWYGQDWQVNLQLTN
jgi:inosine/xanthosine triphosphatase